MTRVGSHVCRYTEGTRGTNVPLHFTFYHHHHSPTPEMTTWPMSGNQQQWGGYSRNSVESAGSRQPPVNPVFTQAPIGYSHAPPPQAGNFQEPGPIFVQNRADTYDLPRNHFTSSTRTHANEYRHSLPTGFPMGARSGPSFVDGSRSFVHNMDGISEDGRHRPMRPLRRPPHWEDDPYPASTFRDSGIRDNLGASRFHDHCCQHGFHHRHSHPLCSLPTSYCSDVCQSPHHSLRIPNGHQHHCTYWNDCSPCERQHSTLTYIGPPACSGNLPCSHYLPHCAQTPLSTSPQQTRQSGNNVVPDRRDSEEPRSSEVKKAWGGVGRWFVKCFCESTHNK